MSQIGTEMNDVDRGVQPVSRKGDVQQRCEEDLGMDQEVLLLCLPISLIPPMSTAISYLSVRGVPLPVYEEGGTT